MHLLYAQGLIRPYLLPIAGHSILDELLGSVHVHKKDHSTQHQYQHQQGASPNASSNDEIRQNQRRAHKHQHHQNSNQKPLCELNYYSFKHKASQVTVTEHLQQSNPQGGTTPPGSEQYKPQRLVSRRLLAT